MRLNSGSFSILVMFFLRPRYYLLALTIATMPARIASGKTSQRSAISAKSGDFWAKSAKQDAKTTALFFGSESDGVGKLILGSIAGVSSARFSRPDHNSPDSLPDKALPGDTKQPLALTLALEPEIDAGLALIVEAWPMLPEEIKAAVVAIVKSKSPTRPTSSPLPADQ